MPLGISTAGVGRDPGSGVAEFRGGAFLNFASTVSCTKAFYHENVFNPHGIIFPMARASEYLPEKISDYINSVSVREPAILARLREETASHPMGGMQIPPEHGQFLALLMQLMGARRTLEVGVFTG
jgi:caffeoyl-CoA O-methyltransferase